VKPEPLAAKTEAEEKLAALVTRRSQLLDLINQETNRLQQTRDREEIAKLVGVAPINRDSGTWKGQRFVMGGRAHVRRVLYMATLVATRCNEKIRAHYLHLLARGKAKKLALVACMRKLLTILNTLLKNDVLWSNERSAPGSA
jgi:transposase